MSVRRTQQSLRGLWSLTMDTVPHTNGRVSPPPRDVEGAAGFDGYCDPSTARRLADGDAAADAAYQHGIDVMQPPRLQSEGPLSKLVLCFCFTILMAIACLVWSFFLQLSVVERARGALADVVQPPGRFVDAAITPPPLTVGRSMRRMPALLKRFAKLERAKPPAGGADEASLLLLFPNWFDDGKEVVPRPAMGDVAMALSMLIAHEVAEETDAPPPSSPAAEPSDL